jgi:hypothetical protein
MYSPQQVNFVAYGKDLDMYLDATGAGFSEKKALLYSLVAKAKHSTVPSVVVAELIMERHKAVEISTFLDSFVSDVRQIKPKGIIADSITVDFSYAMINAVSRSFNEENILHYIQRSYHGLMNDLPEVENKTKIFLCTGHILKAFSRHMSNNILDRRIRNLALHALGSLA